MSALHYYYLLNPLKSDLKISSSGKPDCSIEINDPLSGKNLSVEFFLKFPNDKMLSHFRVVFPDFEGSNLNEKELDLLHSIKENILGVLRIVYSPMVTLYPLSFQTTGEIEMTPIFPDTHVVNEFSFDLLKATAAVSFAFQTDMSLFTDSYGRYFPITHRYLSLYKIFDRYADNRKIKIKELLKKYLSPYIVEYEYLVLSNRAPWDFAIALRDKCAHSVLKNGKTGSRSFIRKDVVVIEKFVDFIMQRATVDLLNDEFNKKKTPLGEIKLHWVNPPKFSV